MGVNRVILVLALVVALAGCQSVPNTTVIAPQSGETGQRDIQWVKRGNVLYLQAGPALYP